VLIADGTDSFARTAIALLNDPKLRERIALAGRSTSNQTTIGTIWSDVSNKYTKKRFQKLMLEFEPSSDQVLGEPPTKIRPDRAAGAASRRALSRQAQRRLYLLALVLSDAVALGLAFALAYFFRFALDLEIFEVTLLRPEVYLLLFALLTPFWLLLFICSNLPPALLVGWHAKYSRVSMRSTLG
jgi:hypothetical protein